MEHGCVAASSRDSKSSHSRKQRLPSQTVTLVQTSDGRFSTSGLQKNDKNNKGLVLYCKYRTPRLSMCCPLFDSSANCRNDDANPSHDKMVNQ
jgi:hypothetical protein